MNGKTILRILLAVSLCLGFSMGQAQQTTEKFIPIGMSPGVSGKSSFMGSIIAVNSTTKSFSMQTDGDSKTIGVTSTTRIWLDRSKSKKSNQDGEFGVLEAGKRVEVLVNSTDPATAAWIKIEVN